MAKKPTVTIPVRLELEYMLDQRYLARGMAQGQSINEQKLRLRLRHIAMSVAHQKVTELSAVLGKPVQPPSQATINAWVDQEAAAVHDAAKASASRQDGAGSPSLIKLMQEMVKVNAGQQERRASAAILSLNADIIEEVAVSGGSTHYQWNTERDSRVRDWHADLEGTIQSWEEPPMGGGSHADDHGHPGSGYGCRCIPIPIQGAKRKPARVTAEPASKPIRGKKIGLGPDTEINTGYKGPLKPNMALHEAEDVIRSERFEHAFMVDEDGMPVMRATSNHRNKVILSEDEIDALKKHPTPITFTHNHPSDIPILSGRYGDVGVAVHIKNFKEYRCVTPTNGGMTLRVTDRDKWLASGPELLVEVEKADQFAIAAAERAEDLFLRQSPTAFSGFGGMFGPGTELARKGKRIYMETQASEFARLLNEIGGNYGFKVERF